MKSLDRRTIKILKLYCAFFNKDENIFFLIKLLLLHPLLRGKAFIIVTLYECDNFDT